LERNRSIAKEWYTIFIDRVHLLVPSPEKLKGRKTMVDDIVLFVFSGEGTKGGSIWKLGRVVEIKSDTTVLIQYSLGGGDSENYPPLHPYHRVDPGCG